MSGDLEQKKANSPDLEAGFLARAERSTPGSSCEACAEWRVFPLNKGCDCFLGLDNALFA